MTIQGALQTLAGAFIAFYLACASAGRLDIPLKLTAQLHAKAITGTAASWGCPSISRRRTCDSYEPNRYRR